MTATDPRDLVLHDDELAFLKMVCVLFAAPESPLRAVADVSESADLSPVYDALVERGLLSANGTEPSADLLSRLLPVAECEARVRLMSPSSSGTVRRDYYVAERRCVEYRRDEQGHVFGAPLREAELAEALAARFSTKAQGGEPALTLSAGDYLVFAVFARDVRDPEPAADDAMSIDEVLAYFDEPETKYVRTPTDDSWNASVRKLAERGVLSPKGDGYELHPRFHPLAREIAADQQYTIARYDYLDERWLMREVSLYPTSESVFRVGAERDGAVVIQELSSQELLRAIAKTVCTLPNLLSAEGSVSQRAPSPLAP